MTRLGSSLAIATAIAASTGCDSGGPLFPLDHGPARSFRMGFSAIPPKMSDSVLLANLDMWSSRSDAAIMHVSVPYKAILAGTSATTYVDTVDLPLANYYRAKHLQIVVTLDVTDGLNRAAEAPDLVELGRSITEPAIQQVYRDYAHAMASIVHPEYLGLAAETNLIRGVAPDSVYDALVTMTNAAAADVHAMSGTRPQLFVSVQADEAWGRLLHANVYQGVDQDYTDFPFIEVLGLSSYPYFVYADPDDVPLDYYSRIVEGRTTPEMVVEGGWASGSVGSVVSSTSAQARYLRRQAKILDSARALAVFQLTFADLDIASFPPQPPGSILPLFAQLGLVDTELRPKPALAVYDSVFARPLDN